MAMSTMMENSPDSMNPFCKPMLRMINSMSPREFIKVPTANAVG